MVKTSTINMYKRCGLIALMASHIQLANSLISLMHVNTELLIMILLHAFTRRAHRGTYSHLVMYKLSALPKSTKLPMTKVRLEPATSGSQVEC